MNKSMNAQVETLAKSKNINAIKAWWNTLSGNQKSAAIAAMVGLSGGAIYYFIAAGVVATTSQAIYGAVYAGVVYGTCTYLVSSSVLNAQSLCDNCEEAKYYDIEA